MEPSYLRKKQNISIVGLGGIGSILSEKISRFLNYAPSFHGSRIKLIDGDEYEEKNLQRQEFGSFGNKAVVKSVDLKREYPNLNFETFGEYVNFSNISEVLKGEDVIFLCVDNHKTRKLVSNFAEELQNVILISGGNDFIDGNVQTYIRKDGKDITPSLTDYHPEIETPKDKSPDEMSCEELAVSSSPQLFFANLTAATIMCWSFYNSVAENKPVVPCEVYFDIEKMKSDAKVRATKNKSRRM
jgi:molybdopterin/thiamine biosynthesis adenylyltransferase